MLKPDDSKDIDLSDEMMEAIQDSIRSDASKVIEYLEAEKEIRLAEQAKKEERERKNAWKRRLLLAVGWISGIGTALFTQWLIKLLGLE